MQTAIVSLVLGVFIRLNNGVLQLLMKRRWRQ